MRNFIVLFMLFILISSIMFVIIRPVSIKETKNDNTEKTRVEKLISGSKERVDDSVLYEEHHKNMTNVFDEVADVDFKKKTKASGSKVESKQKVQPFIEETRESENNKNQSFEPNKNFQDVSRELSEKYGNNPDAEVSEEDINNFMIKMLKTVQNQ